MTKLRSLGSAGNELARLGLPARGRNARCAHGSRHTLPGVCRESREAVAAECTAKRDKKQDQAKDEACGLSEFWKTLAEHFMRLRIFFVPGGSVTAVSKHHSLNRAWSAYQKLAFLDS